MPWGSDEDPTTMVYVLEENDYLIWYECFFKIIALEKNTVILMRRPPPRPQRRRSSHGPRRRRRVRSAAAAAAVVERGRGCQILEPGNLEKKLGRSFAPSCRTPSSREILVHAFGCPSIIAKN